MKRRELFSSLASSFIKDAKQEKTVRPPYFGDESLFNTLCQICNAQCTKACESNIIFIQEDKTPKLDFSHSGCTYCDNCAEACPTEVLNLKYKKDIDVKISIDIMKCLNWNQIMCFLCKDPCLEDAIDFIGMFRPELNDKCTSCGFCIKVCPTSAITIGA